MIKYRLVVAYGTRGRGVFALEPIPEGAVVEVAPCVDVPAEEVLGLSEYVFNSHLPGTSRVALGYGMLYTHSFKPNLVTEHDASSIIFIALRDIKAGEELTHDYGTEYWEGREVRPRED